MTSVVGELFQISCQKFVRTPAHVDAAMHGLLGPYQLTPHLPPTRGRGCRALVGPSQRSTAATDASTGAGTDVASSGAEGAKSSVGQVRTSAQVRASDLPLTKAGPGSVSSCPLRDRRASGGVRPAPRQSPGMNEGGVLQSPACCRRVWLSTRLATYRCAILGSPRSPPRA